MSMLLRTSPGTVLRRLPGLLAFTGYFLVELVKANLEVTWDLLTPGSRLAPGIVRYEMLSRTSVEVALFADLVTMTPGTLVLTVTDDPPTAFVHGMYAHDPDDFRQELRELEGRLLRAWRTGEPA